MATQFRPPLYSSLYFPSSSHLIKASILMDKSALGRRRLALLSSHIKPVTSPWKPKCIYPLVVTNCTSSSNVENTVNDCVFCKIVRGELPAMKVYEDDVCLCFLDTKPLSRGHSLIIPRCHFSSLKETPASVVASMFSKVPLISSAVIKATGCDSFNLLVNNGKAAGQVIFHTHIHIIPRKVSDCLWDSESLRRLTLKLDQDAKKLAENIRLNLPSLGNIEDSKSQDSSLIDN